MIIYIYTPSPLVHDSNLCVAHRVTSGGSRVELYNIIVGLSALLVSTNRAIPAPQDVERVTDGSTFLFCILSLFILTEKHLHHRSLDVQKVRLL